MTTTSLPENVLPGRAALEDLALVREARASLTEVLDQVSERPFADETHAQLEQWLAGDGEAARQARERLARLDGEVVR